LVALRNNGGGSGGGNNDGGGGSDDPNNILIRDSQVKGAFELGLEGGSAMDDVDDDEFKYQEN